MKKLKEFRLRVQQAIHEALQNRDRNTETAKRIRRAKRMTRRDRNLILDAQTLTPRVEKP